MESLPGDVLLVILRKLAVQDPLSLLRVTHALAPLYCAAAENLDTSGRKHSMAHQLGKPEVIQRRMTAGLKKEKGCKQK